ncbi:hypothetical protein D3C79_566350 [compost metagenome]
MFIVIEPAHGVAQHISRYLQTIRDCKPAKVERPVLVPGDRALIARRKSLENGVKLPAFVWNNIQALAR